MGLTPLGVIMVLFGAAFLAAPGSILSLYVWWYGKFGITIDRNHPLWSATAMRVFGIILFLAGIALTIDGMMSHPGAHETSVTEVVEVAM